MVINSQHQICIFLLKFLWIPSVVAKPDNSLFITKQLPLFDMYAIPTCNLWSPMSQDNVNASFRKDIFARYQTCQHVHFVGKRLFLILGRICQTMCARTEKCRDINQKLSKFYHGWIITILVLLTDVTFCSTFRKIPNRERA